MAIIEPNKEVWNRFWESKSDIDTVYPSSPSVLHTITDSFAVQGMKILEVGAGSGRDSAELARLGADVTVLDFSEASLQIVNKLRNELEIADNLHLVRGDAFNAPFADGSFDLVFHQGLAEHFKDPLPLLVENYRLVKPGGFCLCDVPQTFHIYTILKHILIKMDKWFAGWETQFTMRQLQKLMENAQFVPVYKYGDWMRPNIFYRMFREALLKIGVELPRYPFPHSSWAKFWDNLQDKFADKSWAHHTQLSIGILAQKKEKE
ncbi:MAG: class I SAM-dependent methyltransferase [Fibrobacter sp.]|nr:class I SAM-dependent methyltransferase [Fibrobacter sp.]